MTAESESRLKNCPVACSVRWGVALALFEIGLALPNRFAPIDEPLRMLLFFLFPMAAYGFAGLGIGFVLALGVRIVPAVKKLALWIPPLIAAVVAGGDLIHNAGHLFTRQGSLGPVWWSLIPFTALALFVGIAPLRFRPAIQGLAHVGNVAGLVLTIVWMLGERDPARGVEASITADASKPTVVMITWDTVQARVLPIHGGTGLETPNLDALAARGVVFDDMTAVAPITGPSHASLLTGVVPPTHGLRSNGSTRIEPSVPRVSESFRDAGYDTAAFVAAYPVKGQFGFPRGFRVFDDRLHRDRLEALMKIGPMEMALLRRVAIWFKRNTVAAVQGDVILPRAIEYIEATPDPFFAWFHFFDAHEPFEPDEPFRGQALAAEAEAQPRAGAPELDEAYALYRAEIMELDAMLGEIVAALEQRDPGLANTAILLTSDHGHCFGEHGYMDTHIPSLLEVTQHIPGVLHLPGGKGAGRRVPDLVNQIDVPVTLCSIAGVAPPEGHQGVDLLPAATGTGPVPARGLFAEGMYMEAFQDRLRRVVDGVTEDDRKIGLRDARWKYWQWMPADSEDRLRYRLYELARGEGEDRSEAEPDVLDRFQREMKHLSDPEVLPVAEGTTLTMDPADRDALAQLGYLDDDDS